MSNADSLRASYAKESAYGTSPTGSYKDIRITGESMVQTQQTIQSNEIIANRRVRQIVRSDLGAGGAVNAELSYETYHDWLAWALCHSETWQSAIAAIEATDNQAIVFTPVTGNVQCTGAFAGNVTGRWLVFGNLTSTLAAMNGKLYKVVTKVDDDNAIVVGASALVSGTQAASVSANGTITFPEQIVDGSTLSSFTLEYHHTDLTSKFRNFPGCQIDQLSMEVSAQGIATLAFTLLGKKENLTSSSLGSGYTLAPTWPVMNGIDNVAFLTAGLFLPNTTRSIQALAWNVQLANNLRKRNVLGTLGPIGIGLGKGVPTGTTRMYFADSTVRADFLNFGYTSQAIEFIDSSSNRYLIDFPRVQYSAAPMPASGPNTDIVEELSWAASESPTELVQMRIVRITAP